MLTKLIHSAATRRRLIALIAAIGAISAGTPFLVFGQGQPHYTLVREQGFGPLLDEESSQIPPNRPATGAVNVLLSNPRAPGTLYAGGVSGGVWKTLDGFSRSPHWIPLTDKFLPQLSISSLALSPVNPDFLFAGTGSTSSAISFNSVGLGIGVARSLDGGRSWQLLAKETFVGRAIVSIVPTPLDRGNVVLAATWLDGAGEDRGGGVYRSTDMGSSFVRISGSSSSGLPDAGVSSLIGDPRQPKILYAAVPHCKNCKAEGAGIYRSDDGGLRWVKIDRSPLSDTLNDSLRILLTLHSSESNNILFADIINLNGGLGGVFRTNDKGSNWQSLAPLPPIYHGGTEPNVAGTGGLHAAFAADPVRPGVVVIGGNEEDQNNPEGCVGDTTIVYRFDPGVNKWESVVCNGAHGTAPHADSRFLAFSANGDLLFTGDGGPNRLLSPADAARRRWVSLAGDLRTAEIRSIAFDPLSNVLIGGAQDNGASYQLRPGSFTWCELLGGDGGVVAVDADQSKHPGTSYRFMSSQNLEDFTKTTWDRFNRLLGATRIQPKIVSGPGKRRPLRDFDPSGTSGLEFSQPYELNVVDPSRMVIRTSYLYESLDAGDDLANLGCFTATGLDVSETCPHALVKGSQAGYGRPIAYGGRLNGEAKPDVFYIGAGDKIFHRTAGTGATTILNSYPGADVITVAMNPTNYKELFVSDNNNKVWTSADEGTTWTDITGNLNLLTFLVTTIEPRVSAGKLTLYAGGFGVFRCDAGSYARGKTCLWSPIVPNVNPALALDLRYNSASKLLAAATLGRGAWLYRDWGGEQDFASNRFPPTPIDWSQPDASASTESVGLRSADRSNPCQEIPTPLP